MIKINLNQGWKSIRNNWRILGNLLLIWRINVLIRRSRFRRGWPDRGNSWRRSRFGMKDSKRKCMRKYRWRASLKGPRMWFRPWKLRRKRIWRLIRSLMRIISFILLRVKRKIFNIRSKFIRLRFMPNKGKFSLIKLLVKKDRNISLKIWNSLKSQWSFKICRKFWLSKRNRLKHLLMKIQN